MVFFETITESILGACVTVGIISLGGTAGSSAIYMAARMVGQERSSEILKDHGKKILLKQSDLEAVNYYFEKWGNYIVFFGRWLPTFRSLVSIPAGLSSISVRRFVILTFAGTLAWNIVLCSLVIGFRSYLDYLEVGLEGYAWLMFSAVLLFLAYFLVKRISERAMKEYFEGKSDK